MVTIIHDHDNAEDNANYEKDTDDADYDNVSDDDDDDDDDDTDNAHKKSVGTRYEINKKSTGNHKRSIEDITEHW